MKKDNLPPANQRYRKLFMPPMANNWWRKSPAYLFYILREATAFFMIWISAEVMYGVICSHMNEFGQDEFYRFIFFLQNPLVVIVNTLALIAALLHTVTWFNLAPKAINLVIAGQKPPAIIFILALWIITVLLSTILFMVILGYL